jgi:hypothetical protein
MAGLYGDFTAKTIQQGDVALTISSWVPLVSGGTSGVTTSIAPLAGRRQLRIQAKSVPGGALALAYGAKKADGTYETPNSHASSVKIATVMPGNTTWVEPVGDAVQVYGRLVKKKGFTSGSIRVIVTEYS